MFIGGLARVADAKCVAITFSYPNTSPHSMIHVTRVQCNHLAMI